MDGDLNEYEHGLVSHYRSLVLEHGNSYRSVDWGSQDGQRARFNVLGEIASLAEASVLDVGCGVGHFAGHLARAGFKGQYVGIDVVEEMVEAARGYYAEWYFEVTNIMECPHRAEYVFGSGLFTFANQSIFEQTVAAMFAACDVAVAFNSLSGWADEREQGEFHPDPLDALRFCRTLTPWVSLRHDYMPHDFTIYMYRSPRV